MKQIEGATTHQLAPVRDGLCELLKDVDCVGLRQVRILADDEVPDAPRLPERLAEINDVPVARIILRRGSWNHASRESQRRRIRVVDGDIEGIKAATQGYELAQRRRRSMKVKAANTWCERRVVAECAQKELDMTRSTEDWVTVVDWGRDT